MAPDVEPFRVDVPDDELDDVYEHLARHYREFDEEPPER